MDREVSRAGSLPRRRKGAPYARRPGVEPEAGLGWCAHPFGDVCAGGVLSTLLLLPDFQEWLLDFLVSLLFEFAPSVPAPSYFQSLIVSFYFEFQAETFVQVQSIAGLQQKVEGPNKSHFQEAFTPGDFT